MNSGKVERKQVPRRPAYRLGLKVALNAPRPSWVKWRNHPGHRKTQARGRNGVFADYRLRVASVIRDYGLSERGQAPADSRQAHGHASPSSREPT